MITYYIQGPHGPDDNRPGYLQGTLGYVYSETPQYFFPVAGYHDWKNGVIMFDAQTARVATVEDFRTFRVAIPPGHEGYTSYTPTECENCRVRGLAQN